MTDFFAWLLWGVWAITLVASFARARYLDLLSQIAQARAEGRREGYEKAYWEGVYQDASGQWCSPWSDRRPTPDMLPSLLRELKEARDAAPQ